MNSYWVDSTKGTNYSKLENDLNTDVCIIGGRNNWNFYSIYVI